MRSPLTPLQEILWLVCGKAAYSEWVHTGAFADTSDKNGPVKGDLLGSGGEQNLLTSTADREKRFEWRQLGLPSSVAGLGEMEVVHTPASGVVTEAER